MDIDIIPQKSVVQIGFHCHLDDIDDFVSIIAEKSGAQDLVAVSVHNGLQITGSAAE
ncbi:MAG: hypothetical protein LUC29_10450 [Acidaminococcaceae bacterium]|nr:hypothetical protein [Acidaminococcaceae bacterium]